MEGLGQSSSSSLIWKIWMLSKINGDDDDDINSVKHWFLFYL